VATQFNHKYVLQFGKPISFYSGNGSNNLRSPLQPQEQMTYLPRAINSFIDPDAVEDKSVELTQHNISFDVDKDKESGKESTFTIYNISDSTRSFLEQYQGDNPSIVLYAGYETDTELPLIFKGEVISYSEVFQGHTRVTTILAKSGATNLKEAYSVRSYKGGTKFNQIIEDMIEDLRLPKGTMYFPSGSETEIVSNKPVIVNSPTIDFIKKFSLENGYKFWIEDGTANLSPIKIPMKAGQFVFEISADTNMIGSPSPSQEEPAGEKKNANRKAVTVKTTLNGSYQLAGKVSLVSKYHSGIYEIEAIKFAGTYEGSDWYSQLQLKPVDGWEVRSES
jgi:hypothetical protein